MLITFPDITSLEARYGLWLSRIFAREWLWQCCHIPLHTWEFTPKTARAMFNAAGFDTVGFRRASERPHMTGASRALYAPLQISANAVGRGKTWHPDGIRDPATRLTPWLGRVAVSAMTSAVELHPLDLPVGHTSRFRLRWQPTSRRWPGSRMENGHQPRIARSRPTAVQRQSHTNPAWTTAATAYLPCRALLLGQEIGSSAPAGHRLWLAQQWGA